jgi:hypothetical protein
MFVVHLFLRFWLILLIAAMTIVLTIVQAIADIFRVLLREIIIPALDGLSNALEQIEPPTQDYDAVEAQYLLDRAEMRLAHANTLEAGCDTSQSN